MASDEERRRREHEEQQASSIKVTDKRAFTREGERRDPAETPADPPAAEAPADLSRSTAPPEPSPLSEPEAARPAARSPLADLHGGTPEADAAGAGEEASIDFVAFVQSLYVGALMALGEVENPYTRQFETNLDLARQNIDILVMLREKTRGNLTREEDGFIQQVVPQLQLLFAKKAG